MCDKKEILWEKFDVLQESVEMEGREGAGVLITVLSSSFWQRVVGADGRWQARDLSG